jgi:hypothetical protein
MLRVGLSTEQQVAQQAEPARPVQREPPAGRSRSRRLKAAPRKSPAQQLQAPEDPQQDCSSCFALQLTWGAFLFPAQLLQQCVGPGSSLPWRLDVLLDLTVDGAALLRGDGRAEVMQVLVLRDALQAGCPGWRQLAAAAADGDD